MADVTILGIETSCDETAAAVVRLKNGKATILSETVRSQVEAHAPYGGVVPEIAARAHADIADRVVEAALSDSGLTLDEIDGVAATSGPGLIGGVMVGMMTGKAMALAADKPFIPVNHLEGHALSPRLATDCAFPYLLLLVSGGHCQFIRVRGLGDYTRLGTTIDDAAGEAFDKLAKLLALGFPGGPAVEEAAKTGDPARFKLPRPLLDRPNLDMSFAGLKTAAARIIEAETLDQQGKADLCASYQAAIADCLSAKADRALAGYDAVGAGKRLVVAGGVAANSAIRAALDGVAQAHGAVLIAPPLRHCTDNAAMIALAGAERLVAGDVPDEALGFAARPRWPLDEARALADPAYGGGKRGAKA
ncbi:tRNA (adenosine(37)-N6)-threonylcarbamoyltransferase complex transferase subunit TsaD [Henriciella aquimarina]|uniref:tRNA (adenosine(37)-N6)-threonylcarbamoyltransferase complex transferase subunit TsaD n=1 Tax=Henriciella aquimarina TaxID=545261 RepID=UPI00117BD211|nr:tRNA (adenosine(37)-N6)-threonylcarbamoyltransferase complex transferase subunit TsaD [Henriciella aquimarina]